MSQRYGVDMAQIVLGNGSNDVLELAARAFLAPGLEAIYSQHAFAVYPLSTQAAGASGVEVPAREFAHDLAAMRKALTPRTRLCFLANPNNPTGTITSKEDIQFLIDNKPKGSLLLLDEAYTILNDAPKADSVGCSASFQSDRDKYLSKLTLAGLRVGYVCSRRRRRSDEPGAPAVQCHQHIARGVCAAL